MIDWHRNESVSVMLHLFLDLPRFHCIFFFHVSNNFVVICRRWLSSIENARRSKDFVEIVPHLIDRGKVSNASQEQILWLYWSNEHGNNDRQWNSCTRGLRMFLLRYTRSLYSLYKKFTIFWRWFNSEFTLLPQPKTTNKEHVFQCFFLVFL